MVQIVTSGFELGQIRGHHRVSHVRESHKTKFGKRELKNKRFGKLVPIGQKVTSGFKLGQIGGHHRVSHVRKPPRTKFGKRELKNKRFGKLV